MKLTREQLQEVFIALMHGSLCHMWEGVTERPWWELSDDEKVTVLADVRTAYAEFLRNMPRDSRRPADHEQFLNHLTFASIQTTESHLTEMRRHCDSASPSKSSLSGLKQAINDSLSHSHYWTPAHRLTVERRLAAQNLPKLAVLEAMLRRKHEQILKRGKIRTEEEFYLVQEILASLNFPVSEADRQRLGNLVGDFESRLLSR